MLGQRDFRPGKKGVKRRHRAGPDLFLAAFSRWRPDLKCDAWLALLWKVQGCWIIVLQDSQRKFWQLLAETRLFNVNDIEARLKNCLFSNSTRYVPGCL